jgi:hypothetical protein
VILLVKGTDTLINPSYHHLSRIETSPRYISIAPSFVEAPFYTPSGFLKQRHTMASTNSFQEAQKSWQWPWARRSNIFDPPTPLDRFLDSPLKMAILYFYKLLISLRGKPFKPPRNKQPIRIVCISDTHTNAGMHVPLGDLLIHSGDLTNNGTISEIQSQIDWLDSLPHKEKIVICGNHDSYFDAASRKEEDRKPGKKLRWPKNMHYLENQALTLKFKGGRKLNFYGSPDIPACGGASFAFQYTDENQPWKGRIPMGTDVLITHTPPKSHLDLELGCSGLLEEVWQVRPRLHVFGHVHSGHGREAVWWDEGQRAYERVMQRKSGFGSDLLAVSQWIDGVKGKPNFVIGGSIN